MPPTDDSDSCDMDDDEMGYPYGRHVMGGRFWDSYGGYGDEYDSYDEDGYGYDGGPYGYYGGNLSGSVREVNGWVYDNADKRLYTFKSKTRGVFKASVFPPDPADELQPLKLNPFPLKQTKLDELGVRLGCISFPLKLTGLPYARLQGDLSQVPFGYHVPGVGMLHDWRSWEAVFNKKYCLASIILQQHFPAQIPGNLKNAFDHCLKKGVKAPELPKRSVELLPFGPDPTDPQPPPVEHVVRAVLFVDCIGNIPLRIHGVPVKDKQAMSSVKDAVWAQVQPGKTLGSDEALILAHCNHNGVMNPYGNTDTIPYRENTHLHNNLAHTGASYSSQLFDGRPMVCWRVHSLPKSFSNCINSYGDVHYVCVTSYAATEATERYPEPVQLAGRIPVPVLVPVKNASTPASKRAGVIFTGFNEKSAKAIAAEATAIFSKWMTPAGKTLLQGFLHLEKQLFCPLARSSSDHPTTIHGHTSTGEVRLRELGVYRFRNCTDRYRRPSCLSLSGSGSSGPSLINLQLLWDIIPAAAQGQVQLVSPEVVLEQVTPQLFDLSVVMQPHVDASASTATLAEHRQFIKQRALVKQFRQDQQRRPLQILGRLLENATMPVNAATVATRLPAQRIFLKATLRKDAATVPTLDVAFWTQSLAAAPSLSMLSEWNSCSGLTGRHDPDVGSSVLRLALARMLRDNRELARMERDLQEAPPAFSLGTLLQRFEAAKDLPEAPQPAGLTEGIQLHDYQRQSLHWMLNAERTTLREKLWVPLGHSDLWYSPVFGKLSTGVPAGPRGGFLAEEMGLGKTVEVLALVLANPAPAAVTSGTTVKTPHGDFVQSRGTLVICKVSLVGQWVSEARSKLADQSLQVQEYHGGNRPRSVRLLAEKDVVVTTYETLVSDMQGRSKKVKGDANPLARIKWWRIVCDESHAVKDLSSKALKAVMDVQSERRWACSGTPINTDIKDLSGQFAALHMEPLASKPFQTAYLRNGLTTSPAMVHFLLKNLMIRHSKAAVEASGAMRLPPKTEEIVHVAFREDEWQLYRKTYDAARAEFDQFASVGPSYCLTHTLSIMALLMPMRRLCSGGSFSAQPLTANVRLKQHEQIVARAAQRGEATGGAANGAADGAIPPATDEPLFPGADDEQECSICMDGYEAPLRTPCRHWFCSECIQQVLLQRNSCPLCRHAPITRAHLRAAAYPEPTPEPEPKAEDPGPSTSNACTGRRKEQVQVDSKINTLVAELTKMHAADGSNKALIFTQYNDTIRYLGDKLQAAGFAYRTISGSMPMKQRAAAIEAFQRDPPTTVFILSVRSGAVGINLTSANFIFMLEPLMNPALDEQAVGRAWRMGQKRPVTVKRLVMKGTLEEFILSLAKGRKEGTTPPATSRKSNLGSNQAGALRADKANLKFDEMNLLFAAPTIPQDIRARLE